VIKQKMTLHRFLRRSGFEDEINRQPKGSVNEQKLDDNISRAKSKIFEIAYCNPWKYFMTLTIDPRKYDRHDLKKYHQDLSQWLRDYNKKHGTAIKYLLIPERHKDGSWHMHGFLMGLPEEHLEINENGYLDWPAYREKFGYCSIDPIRNHEAVAKYVTKYISKNLQDCIKEMNAHMYYCSKGLEKAREVKKGTLAATNVPKWDYENEHVKCKWYAIDDDILDLIRT